MKQNNLTGLSDKEVEIRIKEGKTNKFNDEVGKSYKDIIKDNIFTLFNLINLVLAILVLITGQLQNMLFIFIIIINIFIGTIQEIRSKKVLDRLSLVSKGNYQVLRNNEVKKIDDDDIVVDDIVILQTGQQIPCDLEVVSGFVEVNESLITGESKTIKKEEGDNLCSGSFIVCGKCYARATKVGSEAYVNTLLAKIKKNKKHSSEMMDSLNKILKFVGIIIIPIGILLFSKQYFISNLTWQNAIIATVAALIGMIPEGVILLTSVTLALSTIRLARKNTLVQELFCIETLARVDTICCDKTGTITKGEMEVVDVINLNESVDNIKSILKTMFDDLEDNNPTASAIRSYSKSSNKLDLELIKTQPFSSDIKCSGVTYKDKEYVIGAYSFITDKQDHKILDIINKQTALGKRVVVLAEVSNTFNPLGLIVLSDPIREDAKETLEYFYNQGVNVKVISGDDVLTVKYIANQAGVKDSDKAIDATTLKTKEDIFNAVKDNNVFGRVTPEQKEMMVECLQEQGHKTAMTGDGVNDVLALKKADCSIAMGNGSEATKNIANLVLLDSNFAHMPEIVHEGRRVINNIQRTTSLFLVKTVFSMILSVLAIFVLKYYPFQPIQLSLVSGLAIGIPAYILSLENNSQSINKGFLRNVLYRSIPSGVSAIILIVCLYAINIIFNLNFSQLVISTMSTLILASCLYNTLYKLCVPFNKLRLFVFGGSIICFSLLVLFVMSINLTNPIFVSLNIVQLLVLLGLIIMVMPLQKVLEKVYNSTRFKKE